MAPPRRALLVLSVLLCTGCRQENALYPQAEPPLSIDPVWVPLSAPEQGDCAPHEVLLTGRDTLAGVAWWPERGDVEAIALPDLRRLEIDGEATLGFSYCPDTDTPSAGLLLLAFSEAGLLSVWMEEE
jgi:hypothetical protein